MKIPWAGASDSTLIVVLRGEPLNEDEIKSAFRGNENTQWYKALVQIIDEDRHAEGINSAAACQQNNALSMASATGAYAFASGLLIKFQDYVESEA